MPWVEKAGMANFDDNGEFIKTADQLLEYYEIVKTSDFNGNGKADEIPLTGYGTWNLKCAFLPMFLKHNVDNFWVDNGVVKTTADSDEYREGLRFIKGLLDKGYLDPLTFTQDHAAMTAMITAETMTIASYLRISASNLNLTTVPPSTDFEWCSALAAPGADESDRFQYYGKAIAYTQYVVTKNCESPEAAVRLGDFWGSEDVSFINNCGFEGIDWDAVSDLEGGADKWGNTWGWGPEDTYVRRTAETGGRASWGTMQNVWMGNQGVSCLNYDWATQGGADKTLDTWPMSVRNANRILYNITLSNQDNVFAGQVYTAEEADMNANVYTPIATYIEECFTRFCMGDLDIEKDWDNYVNELKKMGLEDYTAVEQAVYTRMFG